MKSTRTFYLLLAFAFATNVVVAQSTIVRSNFTGVLVPQFMSDAANNQGGNNKLPVVFRATVSGLSPNFSYQYYLGVANATGGTNVFGNNVYVNSSTATISYAPFGNWNGTEMFTTDNNGEYTGWFAFTADNAAIFSTPNTQLWPVIVIGNVGNNGQVLYRRMLDVASSITVKVYGTTANSNTQISAVRGNSLATAKNFVMVYDNMSATGRPISSSFVENEGVTSATYNNNPTWYPDGTAGAWGVVFPNNNVNGIRRIEQISLVDGTLLGCATSSNGTWPSGSVVTASPNTGYTSTLQISALDAPLTTCTSVPPVTGVSFTNQCFTEATIQWAKPVTYSNAVHEILVFVKAGSAINIGSPSSNISTYTANAAFGSGTPYQNDTDAYAVYKGDGSFVNISNMVAGTTYHFVVFNVGSGVNYSGSVVASGSTITVPNNVGNIVIEPANGQLTVSWALPAGCYDEFLVIGRAMNPTTTNVPAIGGDGSGFVWSIEFADPNFNTNALLNAGEHSVYKGNDTVMTLMGLSNNTLYQFRIYTRKGTVWSAGIPFSATPTAVDGDFRTVQTGNWETNTTWQKWSTALNNWVATLNGEFPNVATANAYIMNGHTVTVTATNKTVGILTVNNGGKVFCNSTAIRFINVHGQLTCNGTIGNFPANDGISFAFAQSANNQLITGTAGAPASTFQCNTIRKDIAISKGITINRNMYITGTGGQLFNNTSGVSTRFNVNISAGITVHVTQGDVSIDGPVGAGNNANSGNWQQGTLTVSGTLNIDQGTLYLTTNNGGFTTYNGTGVNVIIPTGGVINTNTIDASASNVLGPGHNLTVNGELNITGTGGFTSFSTVGNAYNLNSNSTVEYSATGAQTVRSELSYANLVISGSGTKTTSGTTLNIAQGKVGHLTITAGNLATLAATTINLGGNWISYGNAGFTPGTSSVIFNGTASQQITSPGHALYFNAALNNAAGLTLNNEMRVTNILSLTNGRINTGINEVNVTATTAASVSGHNTTNYINGRLRRSVLAGATTYDFPVGNASNYQLAQVKINSQTGGLNNVLAFFNTGLPAQLPNPNTTTIHGSKITGMLNAGFWTIEPNTYTAVNYDITLHLRGYTGFTGNATQIGIIKRDNASSPWVGTGPNGGYNGMQGFHSNATQSIAGGVATARRTGVQSFSDFGIGFSNVTLPVQLTAFDAVRQSDKVLVTWRTESELDCDYFDVQRSADGHSFISLGTVNGNGTTYETHAYALVDEQPVHGINYYRLRQVDFDGSEHFSVIRAVEFAGLGVQTDITLYPVPALNDVHVVGVQVNDRVSVYDLSGKLVIEEVANGPVASLKLDNLSAGTYLLRVENSTGFQTRLFNKQQ